MAGVEHRRDDWQPVREAAMRYRVTWNVEIEADDEAQAREAARQYLLDNEDEALSKVVALEEGSTPRDVPKVDAG
jgi:hypothetical protein